MIIRKPYAFLIKYFKLIHLIIFILSSYVIYRANTLFNFFTEYAETRKITSLLENSNFIPPLVYIFSILIIIFSAIIFILLKEKDKPKTLYIIMMIYYFSFMIFCIASSMVITKIELEGLTPQSARIIRDISFMFFVAQLPFIIISLIRTLGFDIKKFHFGEDLQSLEIDLTDNEEVEITSGIDSDKLYRKIEMKKEDLKEFYFENKVILWIIVLLTIIVVPTTLISKYKVQNKRYSAGEVISFNSYEFKINNAYITKYSYKGEKIITSDDSFVVVNFNVNNYDNDSITFNLDNLKLEIGDSIYAANIAKYSKFIDLGTGYENQSIESNTSKDYIAVYIVSDDDISKNMIVRYTDKLIYKNSMISANYKRVNIKPTSLDTKISGENQSINNLATFSKTILKSTEFNISEYGVKDNYIYQYNNITKYIVNKTGQVLRLKYDFNVDSNVNFLESFSDFLNKYATIVYSYNNKEYTNKIVNITPSDYKDGDLFLAVDENVKDAESIKLVFDVRMAKYEYLLTS